MGYRQTSVKVSGHGFLFCRRWSGKERGKEDEKMLSLCSMDLNGLHQGE